MKKQIQQTTLSLGLLFGLASPSIATAWNIKAESAARNTLASQLKNPSSQMMQVKSPSADNILDAVKKVGGKATVQMGNGNSMKIDIQEKANGGSVIVGSGADELVATSNSSGGSGTVVISPPPMTTSITVVTPDDDLESHSESLYLIKLPKNLDMINSPKGLSEYQPSFFNTPRSSSFMTDVNFNKPFRISAGKYILLQSIAHSKTDRYSSQDLPTFQIFEIKDGENVIFYLRKLTIKSTSDIISGNVNIFYQIKNHEEKLVLKYLYAERKFWNYYIGNQQELCQDISWEEILATANKNSNYASLETNNFDFQFVRELQMVSKVDLVTYLFPGKYGVLWILDNTCNVTTDLSIE